MKTSLLKGLTKEQCSDMEGTFKASILLRKQLIKHVEEDIISLQNSMLSDENYDSPNWSLLQATRIAQIKQSKKLISLLE